MSYKTKQAVLLAVPLALAVGASGVGNGLAAAANEIDDPAVAANVKLDDKLIDSEFEKALLKHFQNRFFNRIDATDEQRVKLSNMLAARQDATRPLRGKLRHEVLVLANLMARDNATDDQIKAQVDVIRNIRDQLADERLKTALAVRSVLTPAQRQQISDRIKGFITGSWGAPRLMGLMPQRMSIQALRQAL